METAEFDVGYNLKYYQVIQPQNFRILNIVKYPKKKQNKKLIEIKNPNNFGSIFRIISYF